MSEYSECGSRVEIAPIGPTIGVGYEKVSVAKGKASKEVLPAVVATAVGELG